jgi:NAD(P)-dependent dehydrogenase (short-subunit alcohol dehydrogenase family)
MAKLEDRVCVVTGGGSGIGAACAKLFVEHGARVVVADVREEAARRVAESLGDRATFVHADVSREADVAAAVDRATSLHGRLDCMVNNAGIAGSGESIVDGNVDELDRMLAVMVRGAFLGTKHAARVMVPARRGCILNVASIAAVHVGYGTHSYSAAKAAVVQLGRSVAMELAESDVRVNSILPGPVATPILGIAFGMTRDAADAALPQIEQTLARRQPNGRALRPEDVARAALWLASDDAEFVTGHALVVDGGVSGGERWSRRQSRGAAARARAT